MDIRIGIGYDSHRFVENKDLYLCGIKIPYELGLLAHSDGDVAIHATIDALLGALALKDIGTHFPDSDERFKGISSAVLLSHVVEMISEKGYSISNIDLNIITEFPKLKPHVDNMINSLSSIIKISPDRISVKAKTNEKMGFVGRGEGVVAQCSTILIRY